MRMNSNYKFKIIFLKYSTYTLYKIGDDSLSCRENT